jgi:hypothetical protein
MATVTYDKDVTALLVIDPYNEFISEDGKLWCRMKAVAEANSCVPHMSQVTPGWDCRSCPPTPGFQTETLPARG